MNNYDAKQKEFEKTVNDIAGKYGGSNGARIHKAMETHLKPFLNEFYNMGLDDGYKKGESDGWNEAEHAYKTP